MKAKDWFLSEMEELKNDVEFQAYDANLRFIEELIKISQKENIEHINKFLSEKLNCSAAYISKILKGNPNLTIKKMVELGLAFNHKIEIKLIPLQSFAESDANAISSKSAIKAELPDEKVKYKGKRKLSRHKRARHA